MPEEVDLIFRPEDPSRRKSKGGSRKPIDDVDAGELRSLVNDIEQQKQRVESRRSSKQRSRSGSPEATRLQRQGTTRAMTRRAGVSFDPRFQTTLNSTIETEATDWFFMNFVLGPRSKETGRSFLEVAAPMFKSVAEGSALHLAVQAVAVAAFGSLPGKQHLAQRSQRVYGKALNAVQRDLGDSRYRTSDATLLSVMMFSLYESITSSEHSLQAWTGHIEGAVTLVKARGTRQFKDPQSLLLFRAVRAQMLTNAIQQRKAIPDFAWLGDIEDDECLATSFLRCSLQVPNLLAKAKSVFREDNSFEKTIKVTALLEEASEVQEAFVNWESQMPPGWHYTSVTDTTERKDEACVEDLEAWLGTIHIYEDVHVACIRNNNRVCQILCCSVMMDSLKWIYPRSFEFDERYSYAKTRVQSLVDEICHSVPFHLYGLDAAEKIRESKHTAIDGEAVGSYFLSWPLYAASNVEAIPYTQRRWIRGRLYFISRRQGTNRIGTSSNMDKSQPTARRNSRPVLSVESRRPSSDPDPAGIDGSIVEQTLEADEQASELTTDVRTSTYSNLNPTRTSELGLETLSLNIVPVLGAFQQNESQVEDWPVVPGLTDAASADVLTSPANLLVERASGMDQLESHVAPKAAG